MSHPVTAAKAAIRARLEATPAVMALLRQPKIHVDPPAAEAFPFIAFEVGETRDAGSSTEAGHVTDLALVISTRHGGTAEGLAIAAAVEAALETPLGMLDGHRFVNLTVRATEARPPRSGGVARLAMRLRVASEVA
jgi:hypothetical protein